ncbi:MAG: hypothetical protein ACI4XL_06270 [Bacillus sp. (in: firmicutes)]
MGNKKEAKFKVGDTVVITMYGTVGKVTDIKYLKEENHYMYEVNNSKTMYKESVLLPFSEYDGHTFEVQEMINIEYKFYFGDLVKVANYEGQYFKVIGFRTEIWRYKDFSWEEIVYELARVPDGEELEANEEDLKLVTEADSADSYFKKLGITASPEKKTVKKPASEKKKTVKKQGRPSKEDLQMVDFLLDLYNDYSCLYENFQDEEYKKVMMLALIKLKTLIAPWTEQDKKNRTII